MQVLLLLSFSIVSLLILGKVVHADGGGWEDVLDVPWPPVVFLGSMFGGTAVFGAVVHGNAANATVASSALGLVLLATWLGCFAFVASVLLSILHWRRRGERRVNALFRAQQAELNELNEIGLPGTATIRRCKRLAVNIRDIATMLVLEATVFPANGESRVPAAAFDASFVVSVLTSRCDRYAAGRTIWIRYDPADRTRVTIDFARQEGVSVPAIPDPATPVRVLRFD
jgi:hypothetical protein